MCGGVMVYVVIKYVVCVLFEGLWLEVKFYNICIMVIFFGVLDIELIDYIIEFDVFEGVKKIYVNVILFDVFVWVLVYVLE